MSCIKKWVLYTACTYSIHSNADTNIKSQPDFVHKALPIIWLIAESENKDALTKLYEFTRDLPSLFEPHDNVANSIVLKYHTADNCAAIQAAVHKVFPECMQGNCSVHVKTNLRKKAAELGVDTDESKLVDIYRMQAPTSPSLKSFRLVSKALITILRKSSNPKGIAIAKNIEEYYVNGRKGNWFHVSSGMVSA